MNLTQAGRSNPVHPEPSSPALQAESLPVQSRHSPQWQQTVLRICAIAVLTLPQMGCNTMMLERMRNGIHGSPAERADERLKKADAHEAAGEPMQARHERGMARVLSNQGLREECSYYVDRPNRPGMRRR